jgi:hypothetical protein
MSILSDSFLATSANIVRSKSGPSGAAAAARPADLAAFFAASA